MSRLTYLAIASRLLLGLLWLSAATFKALDFGGFNEIIRQQYQLPQLVSYAATFLPALETFLGLCLLLEFRVRQALLGSITLLLAFCGVIAYGLGPVTLSLVDALAVLMIFRPAGQSSVILR